MYIHIAVLERVEECNLPLFDVIPKFGWELSQECSSIEKLAAFWVPNAAMRCEGLICVRVTKSPHAVFIACSPKRVSLARSRTWLSLKIGHQNPMIYHPFPIRIVCSGVCSISRQFLEIFLLQHPSMLQDVRGTRSQWKTCQMTCHGLDPRASAFPDHGKAICTQIMQMLHTQSSFQFSQPYSALFCNLEVYIVHEEPAKHKRSGFLCSPRLLLSNFELFDCMDARQPQKMIQDDISPLT